EALRAAARRRLEATLGPAAGLLLNLVESGAGGDALALAVAFEVVFAEGVDEPDLRVAAARLERFHQGHPIDPDDARRLARGAQDALVDLAVEEPTSVEAHLGRANAILVEVKADPFAHLGRLTPLAWRTRLRRFARALEAAIDRPDATAVAACSQAAKAVEGHDLARTRTGAMGRTRMALRILRWLRTAAAADGSVALLARTYRDDLAFADRAREALAGGDDVAELAAAYAR